MKVLDYIYKGCKPVSTYFSYSFTRYSNGVRSVDPKL